MSKSEIKKLLDSLIKASEELKVQISYLNLKLVESKRKNNERGK